MGQLRGQRLVRRDHQGGVLQPLDQPGRGGRLAGGRRRRAAPRRAPPRPEPALQLVDGRRLVAGGRVRTDHFEAAAGAHQPLPRPFGWADLLMSDYRVFCGGSHGRNRVEPAHRQCPGAAIPLVPSGGFRVRLTGSHWSACPSVRRGHGERRGARPVNGGASWRRGAPSDQSWPWDSLTGPSLLILDELTPATSCRWWLWRRWRCATPAARCEHPAAPVGWQHPSAEARDVRSARPHQHRSQRHSPGGRRVRGPSVGAPPRPAHPRPGPVPLPQVVAAAVAGPARHGFSLSTRATERDHHHYLARGRQAARLARTPGAPKTTTWTSRSAPEPTGAMANVDELLDAVRHGLFTTPGRRAGRPARRGCRRRAGPGTATTVALAGRGGHGTHLARTVTRGILGANRHPRAESSARWSGSTFQPRSNDPMDPRSGALGSALPDSDTPAVANGEKP